MKRLRWEKSPVKEDVVRMAYNEDDDYVGELVYRKVGAHMHWCWEQARHTFMSPGCLQEVRDKQKELFNEVRSQSGKK